MNDLDLDRAISRAMHHLFPMPADVALAPPAETRRGRRAAAIALAAVATVAVGLAVGLLRGSSPESGSGAKPSSNLSHATRTTSSASSASSITSPSPAQTVPAWALRCLPKKASDRLGPAPQYVGLGRNQAVALSRQRHEILKLVGANGKCATADDLAVRSAAIAVVLNNSGPSGRIIVAEKVSGYWDRGFPLTPTG